MPPRRRSISAGSTGSTSTRSRSWSTKYRMWSWPTNAGRKSGGSATTSRGNRYSIRASQGLSTPNRAIRTKWRSYLKKRLKTAVTSQPATPPSKARFKSPLANSRNSRRRMSNWLKTFTRRMRKSKGCMPNWSNKSITRLISRRVASRLRPTLRASSWRRLRRSVRQRSKRLRRCRTCWRTRRTRLGGRRSK